MRTAMTALSTLTNLSRAGYDFQHHFGTSMALQPQIVGATGNSAVMSLGRKNSGYQKTIELLTSRDKPQTRAIPFYPHKVVGFIIPIIV